MGRSAQASHSRRISNNTVKTHIRHIYAKLAVNSRNELMALLGVKKRSAKGAEKDPIPG